MGKSQQQFARILVLGPILAWPLCLMGETKPPKITRVANAAAYEFPVSPLYRPQSLVSIFGENLADETLSALPPLPTELGGVRVSVGGIPARLLWVSPTQIDVQIPVFGYPSGLTVVNRAGSALGPMEGWSTPGIFLREGGSCGAPLIYNWTPDGIEGVNSPESPVQPGGHVLILATGAGFNWDLKDGEAAPAGVEELWRRTNIVGTSRVLFNRSMASPSPYSYNRKLIGHVGVDEVVVRVPPDLPEGCSVPLQFDTGSDTWFGQQSHAVPVAISRKPGPCVDPPPDSSAVIRLERVETSGIDPPKNKNVITMEFIRAQGRMLAHEGNPDYIHRRTVRNLPGGSTSAWDYFEKKAGPACPGFETYSGEPLDPGTIIVEREDTGQQAVLQARQNENGQWGYAAELPEGILREGRLRVRGLGGADVGPFEAAVVFPPFQVLTDLSPGAKYRWEVKWSGGAEGDGVRISWGEVLNGRPHARQYLIPAESGETHFWPPSAEVAPPTSGTRLPELNFVVEPVEPGTVTFQAKGLTLGGRLERRMVYRYEGLVN